MKNKVYIGIVSHGHDKIIKENFKNFPRKFKNFEVKLGLIDNINSKELEKFCKKENIYYYADNKTRGYGENINKIFSILNPRDEDIFIVCNPDIYIPPEQLEKIIDYFLKEKPDLLGVKVYTNKELTKVSSQNRTFPCILDFVISFLTKKRPYMKNPDIKTNPDWISGAFMVWNAKSFRELGGFDESYFMYCEDIDICFRAKKLNMKIVYNPNFYVVHESQLESRKFLSKHFLWHVNSIVKFIIKNKRFCLFKS
ncbi:MAG: glycosyltransferase family 2 protein [Aquificae bacterium]|nr:glycosyltransferase family 2 protein [Aquificota bacterium]